MNVFAFGIVLTFEEVLPRVYNVYDSSSNNLLI